MKKDSTGKTGEKIMQDITSDTLALLYTSDTQRTAWNRLVEIIENGSDRDAISAIKEMWDRVMGKPKQSTDVTSNGEKINAINVLITELDGETKDIVTNKD